MAAILTPEGAIVPRGMAMMSPNGPSRPRGRRYRRTRKSTKSTSILALLLVAVAFAIFWATAAPREVVPRTVVTNGQWPSPPAIQAASAAVAVNGRLVLDLNGQIPRPLASTAKIMTAYLALQSLKPTDYIVVSHQDLAATTARQAAEDGVEAPLLVGEHLTVEQVLQALLLPSANNAAVLLAERTSGSEAAFVDTMNVTARQLRLTGAHFVDSSGLGDGTQASTVDMVSLTESAMEEPGFLALVRTRQATFPGGGTITNRNQLLFTDPLVVGGKTGNTKAAGDCLILIGQIRGEYVVAALLGEPSWTATYSDGGDILAWAQRALAADASETSGAAGGGMPTIGRPGFAMSFRKAST